MAKRLRAAAANAWLVTLVFSVVTVAMTWPLASVLPTRIAADVGDPVFACWVMMWTGGQVLRFLSGDFHALAAYWHGNIFYPERLTIAYAEHLTPQMLQILPVFAITHNIVLAYNLLFLSAIVLSGVGMYLFIRELTGEPVAAVVAGAAFAFSPYRADQYAHIQVISSQWMPLALYGFQRYFATGRARALAGAAGAVVLQALSCGYYLFYFTPFAAAYCLFEGWRTGALRNRKRWMQLGITAAVSLAVIAVFAQQYLAVKDTSTGMGTRLIQEIRSFSADTWSVATASENLRLWGGLRTFPKAEGAGFPGLLILISGLVGALAIIFASLARSRQALAPRRRFQPAINGMATLVWIALAAGWIWLLIWRGGVVRNVLGRATVRSISDIGWPTLTALALTLAFIPRFRRCARAFLSSTGGFLLLAWMAALALAAGPEITVHGKAIGAGPYRWLMASVPGIGGLRVPSRFFMVASLFLAALSGIGVAAMIRRFRSIELAIGGLLLCGIVAEGTVFPFSTSKPNGADHYNLVATDLPTPGGWGPVYDAVNKLPDGTVLAELPFGSEPFDIRAMYFRGYHRKPLLNGFSGFFPYSFAVRKAWLGGNPAGRPEAWKVLLDAGVTHVIVHEQPFLEGQGPGVSAWIRNSGGREIVAYSSKENGTDRLFAIR